MTDDLHPGPITTQQICGPNRRPLPKEPVTQLSQASDQWVSLVLQPYRSGEEEDTGVR